MTIKNIRSKEFELSPPSVELRQILSSIYEKNESIDRNQLIKNFQNWSFGEINDSEIYHDFSYPQLKIKDLPISSKADAIIVTALTERQIDSDTESVVTYKCRNSLASALRGDTDPDVTLTEYWRNKGLHGYPQFDVYHDDERRTHDKYIKLIPTKDIAVPAANNPDTFFAIKTIIVLLGLRKLFHFKFPDFDSECIFPTKMSPKLGLYSTEPVFNIKEIKLRPFCDAKFRMEHGVYVAYWSNPEVTIEQDFVNTPPKFFQGQEQLLKSQTSFEKYESCLSIVIAAAQNPVCKTYTYARLKFLKKQFETHIMFNGNSEMEESQRNNHRDFYNVRKEIVATTSNGKCLTLEEVFHMEAKMSAWEASVDSLNVHALGSCFHRFDMFNLKYNPFGQPVLREIFLKTDNMIKGRYLAEITKESIADLEDKKYQMVEWRLSIYGKSYDEWEKLASWVLDNELSSKQVRWMIQVPRLYHIYRKINLISNFGELLTNIFEPVFNAVIEPEKYPKIYRFLFQITGWDSVDDETMSSKFTTKGSKLPEPHDWTEPTNPPYAYWIYYMFANIKNLNMLLASRGMRVMPFRPHCGETGSFSHLASCYLVADGINHGIMLRKNPLLQYMYYLSQIGLSLSPLSNNALFQDIIKNPFNDFFSIGMNVSLSTDDPLMFHFTDEPLLEEYSCSAHVWKLSSVDLCEIARYSVLQSHFEPQLKRHWLGQDYMLPGHRGNDITKTNVPNIRLHYREDTLVNELVILYKVLCLRDVSDLKDLVSKLNP